MSQRLDMIAVLDVGGNLYSGAVGWISSCAVGYADKIRLNVAQRIQRVIDGLNRAGLFGREDFQGKNDLFFLK